MMRRRHQRGNSLIETIMFMPLFILLLVGMVEIARVTFLYYQVHKTLYGMARMLATRQGANLCDGGDAEVLSVKNFVLAGSSDGGDPLITGLTPDVVTIRLERQEADSAILSECECSLTGCDIALGGRSPQYIVVSVPDGFPVNITIPYLLQQTINFHPTVRVPMGSL